MIWKQINGFEGIYDISENGDVRRVDSGLILNPYISNKGYKCIDLSKNGTKQKWLVHRLVAMHFCANPNNDPIVLHLDNNKLNTHYSNLKWGTYSENNAQAVADGLTIVPKPDNRIYYGVFDNNMDVQFIVHGIDELKTSIEYPYSNRGLYSNIFRGGIIKYGPYTGMQIKQMVPGVIFLS